MEYNPLALAVPVNAFGNAGRNLLRTEKVYRVDFSLFKDIPLSESTSLQFRFEAFNAFNIMNRGGPGERVEWTAPGGATPYTATAFSSAGRVSGLAGNQFPRELQFALKLTF